MRRAENRFNADDLAKLEEMLPIVSDELMPEIELPPIKSGVSARKKRPEVGIPTFGALFYAVAYLIIIGRQEKS